MDLGALGLGANVPWRVHVPKYSGFRPQITTNLNGSWDLKPSAGVLGPLGFCKLHMPSQLEIRALFNACSHHEHYYHVVSFENLRSWPMRSF